MSMRYRSVVLDVDSTLSAIEGIDWLAGLRDATVAARVQELTTRAMAGEIPLEEVYAERLRLIQPTHAEIRQLSAAYVQHAVPGAATTVIPWIDAGVRVVLVSGGLRAAIAELAALIGVQRRDVHAVDLRWAPDGTVDGVEPSPLTRAGGKPALVRTLALDAPILAVGDGITDAELAPVVDRFIAFTGVVHRDAVVARADGAVSSYAELDSIVRGTA